MPGTADGGAERGPATSSEPVDGGAFLGRHLMCHRRPTLDMAMVAHRSERRSTRMPLLVPPAMVQLLPLSLSGLARGEASGKIDEPIRGETDGVATIDMGKTMELRTGRGGPAGTTLRRLLEE